MVASDVEAKAAALNCAGSWSVTDAAKLKANRIGDRNFGEVEVLLTVGTVVLAELSDVVLSEVLASPLVVFGVKVGIAFIEGKHEPRFWVKVGSFSDRL